MWVCVLSSFLFGYRRCLFRGCQPPVPGICLHPSGVRPACPRCFVRTRLHVGGGSRRGGGEAGGVLRSIPVAPLRPIKRRAARLRGWLAQSSSLSLSPQRSAHLTPPPSQKPRLFPQTYDGMHCSQRLRLKRFYPTQIPVLGVKLCLLQGYGSKTSTAAFNAQQKSSIFVQRRFQLLLS